MDRGAELGDLAGRRVALVGQPSAGWVVELLAIGWQQGTAVLLDPGLPESMLEERSTGCVRVLRPEPEDWPPPPAGSPSWASVPHWQLDSPRLLLYTSGSSGAPKPVELSTAQLAFAAFGSALHLGHHLDDCWLSCVPLHHVAGAGILFRTVWNGTTHWLEPRFDAERVAALLCEGAITQVSLVPAQLDRVLDRLEEPVTQKRLRLVLVGGSPCSQELFERARRYGLPVCPTWGMSETAAQVATAPPGSGLGPEDRLPPLPTVSVAETEGGLEICGPQAPGGSFLSADTGEVGDDGRVRVTGRRDRTILSGGKNIDPVRSERVIAAHPGVAEAFVLGWPHPRWGMTQVAFVAPREARCNESLPAWCRRLLESWHVPRHWALVSRLPRTALGKIGVQEREWLGRRLETYLREGGAEGFGNGDRPVALETDAGVYVLDASVGAAVRSLHLEGEGEAGLP
jgi:O-succinylbenzoic acid--CoA ligase